MKDIIKDSDMSGIFESVTEVSKANAYKIRVDYATRYRIWREEILPDRRQSIKMENDVSYVDRLIVLLEGDTARLTKRALKEFDAATYINAVYDISGAYMTEINYYHSEICRIIGE